VRILYGDLSCDAEPRLRLRRALVRQGVQYDDQRVSGSDIRTEDDLLRQLSGTDIVVSPRYHNLVLAMMLNKPVIALSYDYKNEALLTEAGLGEYWQRIEELDVSKLIEQFQHAERNSLEIRRLLQRLVPEYRRRWESEYPRVFANL
jgi:polysaccharide pyruvyl transferase WcaK-like protein